MSRNYDRNHHQEAILTGLDQAIVSLGFDRQDRAKAEGDKALAETMEERALNFSPGFELEDHPDIGPRILKALEEGAETPPQWRQGKEESLGISVSYPDKKTAEAARDRLSDEIDKILEEYKYEKKD